MRASRSRTRAYGDEAGAARERERQQLLDRQSADVGDHATTVSYSSRRASSSARSVSSRLSGAVERRQELPQLCSSPRAWAVYVLEEILPVAQDGDALDAGKLGPDLRAQLGWIVALSRTG